MENHDEDKAEKRRTLFHSKGVTYFEKKTERTLFFILTLVFLLWGVIEKVGLFAG
ncbi:MAG: hypothetical protein MUO52_00285 [Desulfobacterales bacterium]|nr:hypothetical protein [Desulfobacterales bacterium]